MSTLANVTDASFQADVLGGNGLILVDFWASWCGPCRMLGPTLEKVQAEMGEKVRVVKVNIDENPGIAQKYKVMNIPLMMLFKEGELVDQLVGNRPKKDIVSMIDKH